MPTGLSIPIGVAHGGGLRLSDSDDNDAKVIKLALGSDDNANAFQQNIGMGEGMIFDIDDPTSRARIVRRLVDIFRRFEAQQRYILRPSTIRWDKGEEQTTVLSFLYVQIESDSEKQFRQQYSKPNNAG